MLKICRCRYLNPALNNPAQVCKLHVGLTQIIGFALYCYIITRLFMGSLSWGNMQ